MEARNRSIRPIELSGTSGRVPCLRDVADMERAEAAVIDVDADGERVLDVVLAADEAAQAGLGRPAPRNGRSGWFRRSR